MQRFTAIITLTAFLLVITMPMLPVPPACAHSAMMANDDACATACHDESPQLTPDDMDMSEIDMVMQPVSHPENLISQVKVTPEEKPTCRIECGCGCNSSPDQFTLTLTPHLPSHPMVLIEPITSEYTFKFVSINTTRNTPPDTPPPRLS